MVGPGHTLVHGNLLQLACSYLDRCFARESPPRASELAHNLGISRTWLNERFIAECGMTVTTFLKRGQLEVAKKLLRDTTLPITTIAYRAAFGTRRSFNRAFVKISGMTPQAYRLTSSKGP